MSTEDRTPVVLSVEQALSLSYGTLRCVHQGFRVIRLEPTPIEGSPRAGDPNRSIGRPVAGPDRHSYYVAPNVGKEALALDLKQAEGRELLLRLIRELPVDVFCTNTLPARHARLGIDYETLAAAKPDLIWCSISAMGCAHPEVPGYDPALQALCGYMDITGPAGGPPMQCGPPLIDLRAGDEAFTQIVLALAERERTGRGSKIDLSMAQLAVAWLQTFLPMLDMGSPPAELKRSGNEHRQFIPVNAYETQDGYLYVAIGSDVQWRRTVAQPLFAELEDERFATNEGRREHKVELHRRIEEISARHPTGEVAAALEAASVPHAPITPIEEVAGLDFVRESALSTEAPDGRRIGLPPPAVSTPHLESLQRKLPFAPAYAEHSEALLAEVGIDPERIARLRARRVLA